MRPTRSTRSVGVSTTPLKRALLMVTMGLLAMSCAGVADQSTTTRAPQPGQFVPTRPESEVMAVYLFYADTILTDTSWTREAMGDEPWLRMLENGALTACASYHSGASTAGAVRAVLDREEMPLTGEIPKSDDVDAYDLLSAIFIGGLDAYCPDLIETIYGSLFSIGFDQAWEELTGGEAPERPIRLPGG